MGVGAISLCDIEQGRGMLELIPAAAKRAWSSLSILDPCSHVLIVAAGNRVVRLTALGCVLISFNGCPMSLNLFQLL